MPFRFSGAAQLNGKPLGGISMQRDLIHEMQLMVMPSNAIWCSVVWSILSRAELHPNGIVCWPDLSQSHLVMLGIIEGFLMRKCSQTS